MKLRPMNDRVVVSPVKKDMTTLAGIILAHQTEDQPCTGLVEAVGPEVTGIQVGQTIYHGRYAGLPISIEGQGYVVLRKSDVLGYH